MQITDTFPALLDKQHIKGTARRPQATKSGPGRRHEPGHKKASPKAATAGAPLGFTQHTNPSKNEWRLIKAQVGARQARKAKKAAQRAFRKAAARQP